MTVPKIIIWHWYYKKKNEVKESKKSKFVFRNEANADRTESVHQTKVSEPRKVKENKSNIK